MPAASVAPSTTMETASAAVETTTTVEPATAVEAMISAPESVVEATASAKAASAIIETMPPVESATVVTASIVTVTVVAMEPGSGADKDATHKVVWTVVAVRRTRIWVIPIVTVGANRSRSYISGTDSNANGNLSMGVACGKHENAK